MQIRILGAAAGGGLPQWNCRCFNCVLARQNDPAVIPSTQSSVAISSDGRDWYLLNASPDIRRQVQDFPALAPPEDESRGTGIAGCVLTDAEIDHASGLLFLREGTLFHLYSTPVVRRWLREDFSIEPILSAFNPRPWDEVKPGSTFALSTLEGELSGMTARMIDLDPHPPIYVPQTDNQDPGSVVALLIEDENTGGRFLYAPGVESITKELDEAARSADIVFFDGTFWSLTEMVDLGLSQRDALDMGHVPISGEGGTLDWFASLPCKTKLYFHINNTNPIYNSTTPEHKAVIDAGIQIARDGDAFTI